MPERQLLVAWLLEAISAGARKNRVCQEAGLSLRTFQRWTAAPVIQADARMTTQRSTPSNALSDIERQAILNLCNSAQYAHLPPSHLYLITDIYSRKCVGWEVHEEENGEKAAVLLQRSVISERCSRGPLVLHSDNGAPMKSLTLLSKMHELGITPSRSRPRVINDNSYSEALFRTLKYCVQWPKDGLPASRRQGSGSRISCSGTTTNTVIAGSVS